MISERVLNIIIAAVFLASVISAYCFVQSTDLEPPEYPCESVDIANKVYNTGLIIEGVDYDILAKLRYGAYSYSELKVVCRH